VGVAVPAAILVGLGYLSLRQWQASSELLFEEQARSMATMACDKVTSALRRRQDDVVARLEAAVAIGPLAADALAALLAREPLVARLHLLDRSGRAVPPSAGPEQGSRLAEGVAEVAGDLWERDGRRHLIVGDDIVLVTPLRAGGRSRVLAVIVADQEVLRREVLEGTLGAADLPMALTVTDHRGRPVYRRAGPEPAELVTTVRLGEALPSWHLALAQPGSASPRAAVRRQTTLFLTAFGLLLVVIGAGLVATFRLVQHETEMARLKADFVANVSHDLKTPLTLIRVFAETLEMGRVPDDASRQEYYQVITRESERLSRLIDNVLDFSRIEGGRRRYDLTPTAVEPLVREALDSFGVVLSQAGFKVDVSVPPDLPEVPMDGEAIGQALANLLDNAVKFSAERKALRVEASLVEGQLALAVVDEGIGIPREEQRRIFDKFYRVGRSDTQGRRGSGLGLSLVRHVLDAHGGRVTVDSRPGEGSRFTLWLPLSGPPA
jgi:signal transduction histidine kinase